MRILFYFSVFLLGIDANAMEVSLLTPTGARVLKNWSVAELREIAKKAGISAQDLIFERSTADLELNQKADIDLVTLYGARNRVARVPRFMIWRGSLKLSLRPDGTLSSRAMNNPLLIPQEFFSVDQVERIELSRASSTYPGTRLQIRTNPAATRGEKLFTQSCMACHSLKTAPHLEATLLAEKVLARFPDQHRSFGRMALDARALRGLLAYREALASEKNSVNSAK